MKYAALVLSLFLFCNCIAQKSIGKTSADILLESRTAPVLNVGAIMAFDIDSNAMRVYWFRNGICVMEGTEKWGGTKSNALDVLLMNGYMGVPKK